MSTKFLKTRFTNIRRSEATGVFFLFAKVGGKLLRDSLETIDEDVAVFKRDLLLKEERSNLRAERKADSAPITLGRAAEIFLLDSDQNHKTKLRTKLYQIEIVKSLKSTWPGFDGTRTRSVSDADCKTWAVRARAKYSATRYNGMVGALRAIFRVAMKHGVRADNPAMSIDRMSVRLKPERVPSQENFKKLLDYFKENGRGFTFAGIQFLAYSGCRIDEARHIRWEDIDLDRLRMFVRKTKTDPEGRTIPIIPDLKRVIEMIKEAYPNAPRPFFVDSLHCTISRAIKKLCIPHFSHHDLRHLFATRCIESGVDIQTVARWLGHKDGGALAMRVYGHLRDDHSQAMAKKVKF